MTKEKMIERLMKIINRPVGNNTKLKMLITSIKAHEEEYEPMEKIEQEKDLISPSI